MTSERFSAAVRIIDDLGVRVHVLDANRLEDAARLAVDKSLRMYDAAFAAMAVELGVPLLTTDAKLCKAVAGVVQTELLSGVSG